METRKKNTYLLKQLYIILKSTLSFIPHTIILFIPFPGLMWKQILTVYSSSFQLVPARSTGPYLLRGALHGGLVVEGRHGLGSLPLWGGGGSVLYTVGGEEGGCALECGGTSSLALGAEAGKAHHGHRRSHCAGLPRVKKSVSAVRCGPKHATGLEPPATMTSLALPCQLVRSSRIFTHCPFHNSRESAGMSSLCVTSVFSRPETVYRLRPSGATALVRLVWLSGLDWRWATSWHSSSNTAHARTLHTLISWRQRSLGRKRFSQLFSLKARLMQPYSQQSTIVLLYLDCKLPSK